MPSIDDRAGTSTAAWRHRVESRSGGTVDGLEVAWFGAVPDGGKVAEGVTVAVEDGRSWAVGYRVEVDPRWTARRAEVWAHGGGGRAHRRRLERHEDGRWQVDGRARRELDGCVDVDLESSACTNTFPLHRLGLGPGRAGTSPAAYLRVPDLAVERLEQRYELVADGPVGPTVIYKAPRFGFTAVLRYDRWGLVLDYPGIATRLV